LPAKLATTVEKITRLSNSNNSCLILEFHDFMKENGASERHQNNNLKAILSFAQFMNSKSLAEIDNKDHILTFLQSEINDRL
jgi:integrase/recombinase XerD